MTPSPEQAADQQAAAIAFMQLCLRAQRDPAALAQARAAAGQPDFHWPTTLYIAHREFLSPLLHPILQRQDIAPAPIAHSLRDAYHYTARRNMLLLNALDEALASLHTADVPVIVLKGAVLARLVYASPALRPLRDLDLLIRPDDLPPAQAALEALGYHQPGVERQAGATAAYENEVMLVKPGSLPVTLELHWSLIDSPYYQRTLPADWFWQTAAPCGTPEAPMLTLGPDALLLYLCAHLQLHHAGQGLLWLNDVAAVAEHYQAHIDWERLPALAQACGMALPARQVLSRAAADLAAPVPAGTLAQLGRLEPSSAEARTYAQLTGGQRSPARRLWDDLAGLPGWGARLRFVWSNLFPSSAYMRERYGVKWAGFLPLYYPYRWWLGVKGALRR